MAADHIQRSEIPAPTPALQNIAEYMWLKLDQFADKQLVVDNATGRSYSGRGLKERAETVALHLHALGIKPRDVVTMYSRNSSEFVVFQLAAFRLGASVALLNAMAVADDVNREIKRTNCTVLYTDESSAQNALTGSINTQLTTIIIDGQHPGCISLSTLSQRPRGVSLPPLHGLGLDPKEDVACILFSSGTAGLPKAVLLTHSGLVYGLEVIIHPCLDLPRIFPLFQPMAHIFGTLASLGSIAMGGKLVTIKQFTLEGYVQLVAKYKVHVMALVPPVSVLLAKSGLLQKYDLSCVKAIVNSVAPLPHEISDSINKQLGGNIHMKQGYGLTETSGAAIHTPGGPYRHLDKPLHPGSVGILMPGFEGKIVDPETGKVLGPDKEGEIWLRSSMMMKGYLNNTDANAATIDQDGWLHTGDIGFYDTNGSWYVVDRLKELIKYNGNQVAPSELENVILAHPAVADVGVVGVPDLMAGELPAAWVVLKPNTTATEKDIADFVQGKVSPHKKLRGGVRFVDVIPKSPSGKILHRFMRDAVRKEQQQNKSKL